jgi:cytoskeletal protein RodZ
VQEDARELVTAATIGEQLRLAREEQQIPLREVSDQTRISVHYLEAIEVNDFQKLPGGIFNRSFVKAYARYVGVDEKEAVEGYTRYMRESGDTGDEVASSRYHSVVYTDTPATRSPILTVVLAIVILAILTAAALAIVKWYQRRSTELLQETSSYQELVTGNYAPPSSISPKASGGLDIWKTDYEQVLQ